MLFVSREHSPHVFHVDIVYPICKFATGKETEPIQKRDTQMINEMKIENFIV